jgi:hypothetical protein
MEKQCSKQLVTITIGIESKDSFPHTSVQRAGHLKTQSRENNSPVKYQCRENVEILVSIKLERQRQ